MKRIVIFASGNGSNAQRIADYFQDNKNVSIELIISNKSDAYVLERAKNLQIESWVIDRPTLYQSETVVERLKKMEIDLIVLAGFLWLIPANLIEAYPRKIINIHPALLPKYGGKGMYGMHVHEAVVANAEKMTGITIHYVNSCYDEGDIFFQTTCAVEPNDSPQNVAQKVHLLEYEWFPKIIENLLFQ
ncbi:MAG: phosphoribosylglycinamide formyltransferase [Bacteroidales bacterium]|jgi:phosphoribosylglycinamide formyltransferase-1|nr:phosphoribosylglycinamide formyltransferase [Bacteroidales bacterium]